MVARHRLGFGQAYGNLRDRAGGLPELAEASRKGGEAEHAEDRRQRRQKEERRLRSEQRLVEAPWDRGPQRDIGVKRADRRPQERTDQGEDERGPARRLRIHRLQDGPHRLTVVVCRRGGGNRRFGVALGSVRGRGAGAEQGRSFRRKRARLENRRRCGGLRGDELRRGSVLDREGLVVFGEIQCAFDRGHRRGDRIRGRILFCHRVRLTPSAPVAGGTGPHANVPRPALAAPNAVN